MRFVPLAALVSFFVVGVVWRSWLQRRRHGHSGWALRGRGAMGGLGGAVLSLLLLGDAASYAFAPALRPWPASIRLVPLGAALFSFALVLMVWAQLDLGASWRIGIDPAARPGLVTDGIYRFCRNPIFTCMLVALAGFVLCLPDPLTIFVALMAAVAVHAQVLAEERYLTATYGEHYRAYRARVGRYLPR
jgi:protein-S-isoprenylcysteine O-methyltransferase Ste14